MKATKWLDYITVSKRSAARGKRISSETTPLEIEESYFPRVMHILPLWGNYIRFVTKPGNAET